jgi:hypothetical protein
METAENGYMRVALINPDGEIIPGKGLEDSNPITGNYHYTKISWNEDWDLKAFQGQDIKIKFSGKYVKLYSFELTFE